MGEGQLCTAQIAVCIVQRGGNHRAALFVSLQRSLTLGELPLQPGQSFGSVLGQPIGIAAIFLQPELLAIEILQPFFVAETVQVQKEFNWCVDKMTYDKYGTKDPSKPGVYWLNPQEVSAMTNAVGTASADFVKTRLPAEAKPWVDTFTKEGRDLSKQHPVGSSWIEKIDCSKHAAKIHIK